jgi:hypothetical protein
LETSFYDSALIGFLLSHFTSQQEEIFFKKLIGILKPCTQLMIIDSHWTEKRREYSRKEGIVERTLNDGRKFRVYKRYLEKRDIAQIFEKHGFTSKSFYTGNMLIAAVGERVL